MGIAAVGLWSRPVETKYSSCRSTLNYLSACLTLTRAFAARQGIPFVRGSVSTIFVAPEFLFTNTTDHTTSTTAMNRTERDDVLATLETYSAKYPGLLLVPGTIVFKQDPTAILPIKQETYGALAVKNLQNAAAPIAYNTIKPKTYTGRSTFPPHPTKEILTEQKEDLLQFYKERIQDLTPQERNEAIRQNRVDTFLIKNRTYVFFDGKRVFTYGKKCNNKDFATDRDQGVFVPGKKEGVVQLGPPGNLKIGFEICYDHDRAILKKHVEGSPLDLQIILSAYVAGSDTAFLVQPGGYVLHASSNPLYTGIARRPPQGKKVENPFENIRDLTADPTKAKGRESALVYEKSAGTMVREMVAKSSDSRTHDNIPAEEEFLVDGGPLRLYLIDLPSS